MNEVILRLSLRRHRVGIVCAALVPVLIGVVVGVVFPNYTAERSLATMAKLFKMSDRFFGGEGMSLFSADGAFSLPFQHPLVFVAMAAAAALPALAMPAGERGRGVLDLVLAQPLERGALVRSIHLVQIAAAACVSLGCLGGALVGSVMAGEFDAVAWSRLFVVAFDFFGLAATLAGAALLISVVSDDRGQASMRYAAAVFGAALIDVLGRFWRDQSWLARLSPFGFHRPARVIGAADGVASGCLDAVVLIAIAAVLGSLAVRFARERRAA